MGLQNLPQEEEFEDLESIMEEMRAWREDVEAQEEEAIQDFYTTYKTLQEN